jgi:restriction system protein
MHSTVTALLGTPQDPADWTSPDEWIPARLEGADRELAMAIWRGTGERVNPRRTYGHWLLATNYALLEDTHEGLVVISARGRNFIQSPGGDAETIVDRGEGLLKLLSLVGEQGPARTKDLLNGWGDYLKRRSRFGSDSTIKDSLYRRLRNLVERDLISRSAGRFSITDAGLDYLNRADDDDATAPAGDLHQLIALAKSHHAAIRASARETLSTMDPIGFEHLVRRLLEAMDYQNVTVTTTVSGSRRTQAVS